MKCPACAMESPEELGYCDFCKEPFGKKKPEAPKPVPAVAVPPAVMAKLLAAKAEPAPKAEAPEMIPPEFAGLDAGEPILPPSSAVRYAAWGFLAVVLLISAVGTTWLIAKRRFAGVPVPRPAGTPVPIPGP